MYRKAKWVVGFCLYFTFSLIFSSVNAFDISYSDPNNWAYCGNESITTNQAVDVFFVCPTVFLGSNTQLIMPINDVETRENFIGAINMEKGIYDAKANFYAPYYRQVGLVVYKMDAAAAAPYFDLAYQDVKDAFEYYLKEYNHDRPIVLAGFSQGADMILRLMKDMYHDPRLQKQLVAAYVVGWRVTPEDLEQYPYLKVAQGECDTGVIVSFNTEAPDVTTSLLVPHKTLGINPLNWKTTSQLARKSLNKGAVFTGYDGKIKKEIPHLTGAFLDDIRGTLKVTDINEEEYPPILDLFEKGVYHIYDYQFFYRNLKENVETRIAAFIKTSQKY